MYRHPCFKEQELHTFVVNLVFSCAWHFWMSRLAMLLFYDAMVGLSCQTDQPVLDALACGRVVQFLICIAHLIFNDGDYILIV